MSLKQSLTKYIPYNTQEHADKLLMLKYADIFDDVLSRDNSLCHFTASCWIVNKEHTKVLMIYHNIYASWSWVGGHADGEADLLQVALKEAKEETGLINVNPLSNDIFAIQIIPVNGHIKRSKYVSPHLHLDCCYLLEADEAESLHIKADENSDVRWIDIEQAVVSSDEEHMKPIYSKLNEKIKRYRYI